MYSGPYEVLVSGSNPDSVLAERGREGVALHAELLHSSKRGQNLHRVIRNEHTRTRQYLQRRSENIEERLQRLVTELYPNHSHGL